MLAMPLLSKVTEVVNLTSIQRLCGHFAYPFHPDENKMRL